MTGAEPATSCLDDTQLALLADGAIAPDRRPAIEAHLDGCEACRLTVAQLARRADAATVDERAGKKGRGKAIELRPGETIGRYIIVQAVGSGAMGTVYLARDPSLDRRIAIKVLRPTALDHDAQVRLLREAQAMAKVDHPHVIAVHDIGEHGDQVFLALEYVGGGNLRRWLETRRSWREVVRVFIAAGRGLAAVHAAGLVHRDFKPDNVLLADDGSVHVGDFGLVSAATAGPAGTPDLTTSDLEVSLTATGVVVGTPAYMAPEQFLGETVDARTDQFAFCAALFEALYGVRPFAGDDIGTLSSAVLAGELRTVPRGDVPRALHALVMRGLERTPGKRHRSMRDVLGELQRIAGQRRRTTAAIGGAAGVVALGIVIGYIVVRGRRSTAPAPAPVAAVAGPCAATDTELAGVWDADRRAAIGQRFAGSAIEFATDTWQRVGDELDQYAGAWKASARDACEATLVRHTQSEAVRAARMTCLADRKGRLRVVADQFVAPIDGETYAVVIANAARLVATLPPIAGCDAVTDSDVGTMPPAAKWAEIAPVDDELRRLEIVDALSGAPTVPEARAVVARADATGFLPLRARAGKQLGLALLADPDGHDEALTVLGSAVELADEGRDDATRAGILALLATDAIMRFDRVAARTHLEIWRAALVRSGAQPDGELQFVLTRAMIELFEGKLREVEADAQRLDTLIAATGIDLADRVDWITTFAYAATEYLPPAQQLAHDQQLLELCQKELGPTHPQTLGVQLLVAEALYYLHRYDEAEPLLLDAVKRNAGPGYVSSGDEHSALGALYRETGRYDLAAEQFDLEADALDLDLEPGSDLGQLDFQRGLLDLELGRPAQAIAELQRAQVAMTQFLPTDHPFVAQVWSALASAERRRGKPEVAYADAIKARDMLAATDGENHQLAKAYAEVGLAAAALGRKDDAITALEAAIKASEYGSILPADLAEVRVALAGLVAKTDRERALALARAAATAVDGKPSRWAKQVATDAATLIARLGTP